MLCNNKLLTVFNVITKGNFMINKKLLTYAFSFIALILSTNIGAAERIPAKLFACYSNYNSMQMSPNGEYIAIVSNPRNNKCDIEPDLQKYVEDDFNGGRLTLYNTNNGSTTTLTSGKGNSSVGAVRWVSDERIIFTTEPTNSSAKSLAAFALWGMNIDGSKKRTLYEFKTAQGMLARPKLTSLLPDDPSNVMVKINERRGSVDDYYKMNIFTGSKRRVAMGPDIDKEEWLSNVVEKSDGTPLAAISNVDDMWRIWRYMPESDSWEIHFTNKCQTPTFFPLSGYDDKWLVAGQDVSKSTSFNEENDRSKLFLYDPNKKSFDLLFEDPVYDVAGPVGGCRTASGGAAIDEKTNDLVFVSYYAEEPKRIFFDEEAQDSNERLEGAFPGQVVRPITWSKDRTKMVVSVSSSSNPGDYYYYDKENNILSFLWDSSPWLDRSLLAEKKPIKYVARDGLVIHGYLTLPLNSDGKNLPVVVHPHGGPNARDTMGYDPDVQFMANRGYAVFQPNFRGSTGYGAYHYISANKQFGKTMQDDITDGVYYLIEQGIADPDRVAIFGGSYGGYATMAGLTFTPDLYAAGINFVGVVDLELLQEDSNRNSRRFGGFYDELRLEWGDPDDPEDMKYIIETSPLRQAHNIKAPVLIMHGAQDSNVRLVHARKLADKLDSLGKEYEWYVEPYEGHGFRGEQSRLNMYGKIEEFLGKHLNN